MTDTSQPAGLLPEFRIGHVLGQTFKTFFANFFKFVLLGTVLYAPTVILMFSAGLIAPTLIDPNSPPDLSNFFTITISILVLSVVSVNFVLCAITYGSIEHQAGNSVTLGSMARRGLKAIIPVILSYLMILPLMYIGMLLLIIPGIIIAIMLSMTTPAIVAEGVGPIAALRRSRELTSGYKWHILGIFILMFLILLVIQFLLMSPLMTAIATDASGAFAFLLEIVFTLVGGIFYALMATNVASIYTGLREAKEGTSADKIAEVFA